MDASRFEALLRQVGQARSRRALLGVALAGLAASPAADAKPKNPTTKKKHKGPKPCFGPFPVAEGLQGLVDSVPANSTVRLCAGTFLNTGFIIRQNLKLVGAGKDQTVLLGRWPAPGPAVTIAAGVKVTLQDLTLANNFNGAADDASHGGGILNLGKLTVTRCTVKGNGAHDGGGLYNDQNATLTLNASEVLDNTSEYDGGGIANREGTLTLNNAVVRGNEAFDGGGIDNRAGTAILNRTTVAGNHAAPGGFGGGIQSNGIGARLEVRRGSVIGGDSADDANTALVGGGVSTNSVAIFAKGTKVTGNRLSGLFPEYRAGGVENETTGTVTLADTKIVFGNQPTNCGGCDNIGGLGGDAYPIPNCLEACQSYGCPCSTGADCCDSVPCTAGRCRLD